MKDWEPKATLNRRIDRNDPSLEPYRRMAEHEWIERRLGDRRTAEAIFHDVIQSFNPGLRVIPQIEDGSFILERLEP